jgi:hypothetical protein
MVNSHGKEADQGSLRVIMRRLAPDRLLSGLDGARAIRAGAISLH